MLQVGVIGTGWVARERHIPAFMSDGRAKVVAIMDPNPEKARSISSRFLIPKCHSSLDTMLDEKLDLVSICTPPWTHSEIACRAMEKGHHVLVEKPMAMTVEECDQMIASARRYGAKLCIAHNFLFSRSMRRATSLIEGGEVGEVQTVLALQLSSPNRRLPDWYPKLPGGLLFDEAPHMVYLIAKLLGGIGSVSAWGTLAEEHSPQPVETIMAVLRADHASALLEMSFAAPRSEWLVGAAGSRMTFYVDVFRDQLISFGSDGRHRPIDVLAGSLSLIKQQLLSTVSSGTLWLARRLKFGHDVLISQLITSILQDREPPVSGQDGRMVIEVLEEIVGQCGL